MADISALSLRRGLGSARLLPGPLTGNIFLGPWCSVAVRASHTAISRSPFSPVLQLHNGPIRAEMCATGRWNRTAGIQVSRYTNTHLHAQAEACSLSHLDTDPLSLLCVLHSVKARIHTQTHTHTHKHTHTHTHTRTHTHTLENRYLFLARTLSFSQHTHTHTHTHVLPPGSKEDRRSRRLRCPLSYLSGSGESCASSLSLPPSLRPLLWRFGVQQMSLVLSSFPSLPCAAL